MTTNYTPAEAFPVGDYLRDELEERQWTVTEFAEIIGRPVQAVSEILNGKKEITTETAWAFADALGTTPEIWLNLQTRFRLFEARRAAAAAPRPSPVARRARLSRLVPLAKARSRGWLPDTTDLDQLEEAACELFGLTDLDEDPAFAMAAKRSNSTEAITPEQIAWLAHVRSVGRGAKSASQFDAAAQAAAARELPGRTEGGPATLRLVPDLLAACGVVVVFSEGLPGGKLDGAVTFLADGRALIGLTTRGDRFDIVLFTLLHEAAHLVLGHISLNGQSIVDIDIAGDDGDENENAANAQATAWLFPDGLAFHSALLPDLIRTAHAHGVHPSVVIGQFQRQTGDWARHRNKIPKVRPDLLAAGLMS